MNFIGGNMSEIIRLGEIPTPLINYVCLILLEKPPYSDIVKQLVKEMEFHLNSAHQKDGLSEVVYAINPRILQEELEKRIKHEKLTDSNVCRTIRALCYGSKLKKGKDWWPTTTTGGKPNYHIRVNQKTLNACSRMLL